MSEGKADIGSKNSTLQELKAGTFIYAQHQALGLPICRDMIRRFEANSEQRYSGRIGQRAHTRHDIKRSTDLRISGREDWKDIDDVLKKSLTSGLSCIATLHPFFQANRFHDIGYNLQRTMPDEFYHWHVDGGPGDFAKRQLVAIWYLNDCDGPGGETDFYFQNVSVRPEAGLLLLFPPFWTHLHRGRMLKSGIKYIATTWICCD